MGQQEDISEALAALFYEMRDRFGDEIESFWFYDSLTCPCCGKNKINKFKIGEKDYLSLNGYMYHDMNVLIGYLLCNRCIIVLTGTSNKQKQMYKVLEQKLKGEYHDFIKSTAS